MLDLHSNFENPPFQFTGKKTVSLISLLMVYHFGFCLSFLQFNLFEHSISLLSIYKQSRKRAQNYEPSLQSLATNPLTSSPLFPLP